MNGKQISARQIPFGPKEDGGSCHGMSWQNGKLWLYANRIEQLMRIDPKSWQVDYMFSVTNLRGRLHGIEVDGDHIWQVCGSQDPKVPGYEGYTLAWSNTISPAARWSRWWISCPAPATSTTSRCETAFCSASMPVSIRAGRKNPPINAPAFPGSTALPPVLFSALI
jgi:hypothetical protein